MGCSHPLTPTFLIAAAAVAVLAAGCGGGTTPPTRSATAAENVSNQFVAFAVCMRSHGVPGYPDPESPAPVTACRSRSLPAAPIPTLRRSSPPAIRATTFCPAAETRSTAPTTKRRTCGSRSACARTESRTSPTPTTTEPSPSRPGSTSRRRSFSARRKHARTSSLARSRSSTNLQVAPNAARTRAASAAAETRCASAPRECRARPHRTSLVWLAGGRAALASANRQRKRRTRSWRSAGQGWLVARSWFPISTVLRAVRSTPSASSALPLSLWC